MSDYSQIGDHRTTAKFETFSYLPELNRDETYAQVANIIAQGWNPGIEHEHPSKAFAHYWPMWKLPFFGETDPQVVFAELEQCRQAYPDHHIRLVGYDNYAQCKGMEFVVFRATQRY